MMTEEFLPGLALFALVSSITPGPNNLMVMTSGALFGLKRTYPHILGISGGFMLMVATVGIGLAELFIAYPAAHKILTLCCFGYLIYLCARLLKAPAPSSAGRSEGKPLSFIQASLFQWINPKAWTMALTAVTVYSPDNQLSSMLWVALVFGLINLPSVGVWAIAGQQLSTWLDSRRKQQCFNITMAVLLLASVIPMMDTALIG